MTVLLEYFACTPVLICPTYCVAVLYGEVPIKFYLYGSHVHMYLHIKQASSILIYRD